MNDYAKIADKAKTKQALSCDGKKARSLTVWLVGLMFLFTPSAQAFRVIDTTSDGFGILRWNAAPHFVDGVERSLDGGLRYSVVGGSYEAFRDELSWVGAPPSVADFQNAVESAFAAWETVDQASGLGTNLRFVPDFDTAVFFESSDNGFLGLNRGAEIDLVIFQAPPFIPGGSGVFADSNPEVNSVTLSSGVKDYPASVISGADIGFNANFAYDLEQFQGNLTHSIGNSLGLAGGDLHPDIYGDELSQFYDDDYDQTRALETLTNSFAHLIDPLDPDNSPGLGLYEVCDPNREGGPLHKCKSGIGIRTPGVDNVMENFPPTPNWPTVLQNDDFAGRQFLYPFIKPGVINCGDFDSDGDVDSADRTIQTTGWTGALMEGGTATFADGDCDGDGDVDTADQTGLIGHWTGALMAGNLVVGDDADLVYDPVTGNVTIDASETASGKVISFVIGTDQNDMDTSATKTPFIDVGTNTDNTPFQIGQTDPLNQGAGPLVDLGNILPTGMDKDTLFEYLTIAEYASELGAGGTLDLVIPEPSGLALALFGTFGLTLRRR